MTGQDSQAPAAPLAAFSAGVANSMRCSLLPSTRRMTGNLPLLDRKSVV